MNPFLQFFVTAACHRIILVAANFSAFVENIFGIGIEPLHGNNLSPAFTD